MNLTSALAAYDKHFAQAFTGVPYAAIAVLAANARATLAATDAEAERLVDLFERSATARTNVNDAELVSAIYWDRRNARSALLSHIAGLRVRAEQAERELKEMREGLRAYNELQQRITDLENSDVHQ